MTRAIQSKTRPCDPGLSAGEFGKTVSRQSVGRKSCGRVLLQVFCVGAVTVLVLASASDRTIGQDSNGKGPTSYGKWTYHLVQKPIEGIEFVQIYTSAVSSTSRNETAFAIRCQDDQLHAVLFTNRVFSSAERITLRVQVDGKKATTVPWQFVRSEAVLMSPPGNYVIGIITSARGARRLKVRVNGDGGVLIKNTYSLAGFDKAMVRFGERCLF